MSKSLGNFYIIRDLIDKGHSPRSIRYLLMSAHYRKQLNFTFDGLHAADQALDKIDNLLLRLADNAASGEEAGAVKGACALFIERFTAVMDDDLNISGAIGKLFEFIHEVNSLIDGGRLTRGDADTVMNTLRRVDSVLGFVFFPDGNDSDPDAERIERLIIERKEAKARRDFATADGIRNGLLSEGIILEDGKEGTRWKRKR